MLGERRQAFTVEVRRDGNVLKGGAELVSDLLVERPIYFLADDHLVFSRMANALFASAKR